MAQRGCIFKKGGSWFLKYREDVIKNGELIKGKQRCKRLAAVCDLYRTEADIRRAGLADETLGPINSGKLKPESTLTVAAYGENYWLPWVRENCKLSTIAGYETAWGKYLAPRLQSVTLRDFRTADAANLLADLHRSNGLGRTMLKHAKSLLSGIFTLARNQGVLDTPNPVQGTMIPKKAAAPSETHAATPGEVMAILEAVETAKVEGKEITREQRLKVQTAMGLMFFAGLRPGEARGAQWQDFNGKLLAIRRSVWHTHTTNPKTEDSAKSVPVIEPLRSLLDDLRQADGNPSSGPILRGPSGKALNLDNLSKRVLTPLLKAAKLEWHGWYSLRRGVATTLAGISKDPLASKGLLRHASLATTERHYIKDVPENTLQAMNRLEALFKDCSTAEPGKVN